jgi:recombination protein RecT
VTKTADTTPLRGELERVATSPAHRSIIDLIERNAPELQKLLGSALTVDQFKTAAMTYLRLDPKLIECNPLSVVGGLRLGAQLGLSLGPLGHFYLVPFKREAVFILGYKGMIELAHRSGQLKDLKASLVREGDAFEYREGTRPFLDHTPNSPPAERAVTHGYAVARLRSGGSPFVVLYPEDIERARAQSPAARLKTGPWETHWSDMALKTCVRRLQRWLPQTPQSVLGIERDETVPDVLDDDVQAVGESDG